MKKISSKGNGSFSRRSFVWAGAIALTLALCFLAPSDDVPTDQNGVVRIQRTHSASPTAKSEAVSLPSTSQQASVNPVPKQESSSLLERQSIWSLREDFKVQTVDAFQPLLYAPPPPPPQPKIIVPVLPPPPPPKPVPPPLPFEYLGKMGNHHAVQKGDDIFELVPGQTIAQDYRVERVSESEAVLIYLPLNESQTLLLKTKDE